MLSSIQSGPSYLLSKNIKIRIYKTIILLVVLYGSKTWSLPIQEAHRLWEIENRMLRRIFGPQRDEAIGCRRKVLNEELHNFYSLLCIIRVIKAKRRSWERHVACKGRRRMHTRVWWESQKERDH
jgi:hypothetical protein